MPIHRTYYAKRDLRGRTRLTDENGNYDKKNLPIREIDQVFEVESIPWAFIGIERESGERREFVTASRNRELQYKAANSEYYQFL